MGLDLDDLCDDFPYEEGKISVRKFVGRDGKEKLQQRIKCGILQMNKEGRPDGEKPYGYPTYLAFCKDSKTVTEEDHRELFREYNLFAARWAANFVLEDYEDSITDSEQQKQILDFLEGKTSINACAVATIPVNIACAQAHIAARDNNYERAFHIISDAREYINHFEGIDDEDRQKILRQLGRAYQKIKKTVDPSSAAGLRVSLEEAVDREDYETATYLQRKLIALQEAMQIISKQPSIHGRLLP